jgi:hypothetical protein
MPRGCRACPAELTRNQFPPRSCRTSRGANWPAIGGRHECTAAGAPGRAARATAVEGLKRLKLRRMRQLAPQFASARTWLRSLTLQPIPPESNDRSTRVRATLIASSETRSVLPSSGPRGQRADALTQTSGPPASATVNSSFRPILPDRPSRSAAMRGASGCSHDSAVFRFEGNGAALTARRDFRRSEL